MKNFFFIFIFFCLLSTATPALAQTEYPLLQPLPLSGVEGGDIEKVSVDTYISGIFMLIIGVAGGLAVIKIIFGGIKYMSSDAIGGKSEAKETIQNAIWGLLLAISAWLILTTINPALTSFNFTIEP